MVLQAHIPLVRPPVWTILNECIIHQHFHILCDQDRFSSFLTHSSSAPLVRACWKWIFDGITMLPLSCVTVLIPMPTRMIIQVDIMPWHIVESKYGNEYNYTCHNLCERCKYRTLSHRVRSLKPVFMTTSSLTPLILMSKLVWWSIPTDMQIKYTATARQ